MCVCVYEWADAQQRHHRCAPRYGFDKECNLSSPTTINDNTAHSTIFNLII